MSLIRLRLLIMSLLVAVWAAAQSQRALLVGISDYNPSETQSELLWNNIHGADDVKMLTPTLQNLGFTVTALCNEKAAAETIRREFDSLVRRCHKGDVVYIHFSCHGQPVEDTDGDEDDGWDESIVPIDARKVYQPGLYEGNNHIVDDELNVMLQRLRAKVGTKGYVAVVIDACHAGSAYRGDEEEDSIIVRGTNRGFSATSKTFAPRIDKRSKIKLGRGSGLSPIGMIEACRSYQTNIELRVDGSYVGSLSYYVNKVIEHEGIGRDGHWLNKVVELMSADRRLIRQNPVVETTD